MENESIRKRLLAAFDLLQGDTTTSGKLESIRTLIHGINPGIDKTLAGLSKAHSDLMKLKEGDIIELSAQTLPETSDKEKRRKKAILLFIKYWNQLRDEVERVGNEIDSGSNQKTENSQVTNILARAKGPLGLVTLAALAVVIGSMFFFGEKENNQRAPVPGSNVKKIKVIDAGGKKIPLTNLTTGTGLECTTDGNPAEHYHALDHISAKALDGSLITDPGGCGFGKVEETVIEEI